MIDRWTRSSSASVHHGSANSRSLRLGALCVRARVVCVSACSRTHTHWERRHMRGQWETRRRTRTHARARALDVHKTSIGISATEARCQAEVSARYEAEVQLAMRLECSGAVPARRSRRFKGERKSESKRERARERGWKKEREKERRGERGADPPCRQVGAGDSDRGSAAVGDGGWCRCVWVWGCGCSWGSAHVYCMRACMYYSPCVCR